MKLLGAIIAGGNSTRMGQDKALTAWRGKTLIGHVADRLGPQVDSLIINANGDAARLAFLGLPVIADILDFQTPLAGLHAALVHAQREHFDAVLSAPCDTPLLPPDLARRLRGLVPAIARSGEQDHFLTGFWPVAVLGLFSGAGVMRVKDFAAAAQARVEVWPTTGGDPFSNVNTREELARLSEMP